MFWSDDDPTESAQVPDAIQDLLFSLDCRRIPVDHAYSLSQALVARFPWLAEAPRLGIHSIHVAGSQNGWERPAHGTNSDLMVSRRTKLIIRAPRETVPRLLAELPGTRLDLDGRHLEIGQGKAKPLSQETTLFARYVVAGSSELPDSHDESRFLAGVVAVLSTMGIKVRKAICGKTVQLVTPSGTLPSRSLMVANLTKEESIRLQETGLGPNRLMGCGIFIPHKGIDAVTPTR